MSFSVNKCLLENVNIGKLEEFVEQIRYDNSELHQKFEEASEELENMNAEIKMLKTQIELKDETIENLRSKLNSFVADAKKGVSFFYAAWKTAGRLQDRDHQTHV